MTDREYEITLDGGGPWGFRLQGGKDFGTPLKIARITPGSKAAVKQVSPGDTILEINGSTIEGLSHMDAQNVIKQSGSVLRLKLKSSVKVLDQTEVIHSAGVDHKFNSKPRAFPSSSPSSATSSSSYQASTPPSQASRPIVSTPKFSPGEYAQRKKEELENRKNQTNTSMEDSDVLKMLKASNISDTQKERKQSGTFQKLETNLHHDNGGAAARQTTSSSITVSSVKRPPAEANASSQQKAPPPPAQRKSPAAPTSPPVDNRDVFRMTYNGPSIRHEAPEGTHVIDDLRTKMEEEDARILAQFERQKKERLSSDAERTASNDEESDTNIDDIRHNTGIYKGGNNPSKIFKYLQYKCGEVEGYEASVCQDQPSNPEFEQQLRRESLPKNAPVVPSHAFQLLQRMTETDEDLPPPPPELMVANQEADYVRPSFGTSQGNPSKSFQKLQSAVNSGDGEAHPSVFNRPAQPPVQSAPSSKYGPKGQPTTSVQPIPKAPMPSGPTFKINAAKPATNNNGSGNGSFLPRSPVGGQPPTSPSWSPASNSPAPIAGVAAQKVGTRPSPQQVPAKVDTKNPLCSKCDEIIKGPFVSAIGKTWHPEHFACASCATSLQNQGFVEEQGQLYCERCYNEFFAPKCATCGKSVVGGRLKGVSMKADLCQDCFFVRASPADLSPIVLADAAKTITKEIESVTAQTRCLLADKQKAVERLQRAKREHTKVYRQFLAVDQEKDLKDEQLAKTRRSFRNKSMRAQGNREVLDRIKAVNTADPVGTLERKIADAKERLKAAMYKYHCQARTCLERQTRLEIVRAKESDVLLKVNRLEDDVAMKKIRLAARKPPAASRSMRVAATADKRQVDDMRRKLVNAVADCELAEQQVLSMKIYINTIEDELDQQRNINRDLADRLDSVRRLKIDQRSNLNMKSRSQFYN